MPIMSFSKPKSPSLWPLYAKLREGWKALEPSAHFLEVTMTEKDQDPEHPRGPMYIAVEVNGWTKSFPLDLVHEKDLLNDLRKTFG